MGCNSHSSHGHFALSHAVLARAPKDFATATTPAHFPPDVPVDWQELTLTVEVDVLARRIFGTATYEGVVRKQTLQRVRFDADAIEILRAFDGAGAELKREHDGKTLWLELGNTLQRGENLRVSVDFDTRDPRAGFYFILPDADHPDRQAHAWTQGQDEDSKFWFPCHDSPNHKLRLHVIATAPEGMSVLSNGALRNIYAAAEGGKRIFDWQLARPTPTYLLTLAVGPFVEIKQKSEPFPISYYVLPGREADGERAFGRTPQMVQCFETLLGVAYPFEKYAQVAVSEFVFGGMENTSMTTQTDLTLHDARAHLDFSSEPLVSHELAHQWFGDFVTCRSWSHGWLNEGFATYFEQLWREHSDGDAEFDYGRLQAQRSYLAEDSGRYRRVVVTNQYQEPIDVFDAHLYEKGGAILHMLRKYLGDVTFFGGIGAYLRLHADGNVETPDLRRALEHHSGLDLGRFFAQWVEQGKGHPELKISGSWDADARQYKLTIEQTQDTASSQLFWLQIALELHGESGQPLQKTLIAQQKIENFFFDLPAAPRLVLVDPRGDLLATVDLALGDVVLRAILQTAPQGIARLQAAIALGKHAASGNVEALGKALLADQAWFVQAEIARVLAKIGSPAAFAALAAAVELPHPKARRAVVAGLGKFSTAAAGDLLIGLLAKGDASYFVEAEAALSLGQTRVAGAFAALAAALSRESWNDTLRIGVLDGLAALQDPQALPLVAPFLAAHYFSLLRCGALRCLGAFYTEPARVIDLLRPYAADTSFRFALNLALALGNLGDGRAIPLLQSVAERAVDGRVKKRAQEAIASVRQGLGAGKQVDALRGDLESLRASQRELAERIEKTEKLRQT